MRRNLLTTLAAAGALAGFATHAQAQFVLVDGPDNPFAGFGPVLPPGEPGPPSAGIAAIADFNGDGTLDLYMHYMVGSGNVRYFSNTGTPSAPEFTQIPGAPLTSEDFGSFGGIPLQAADLDGDGLYDVFAASYYIGGIIRFRNTGTTTAPAFDSGTAVVSDSDWFDGGPYDLAIVDINGDGKLDLFTGGYYGYLRFFENQGDDTWVEEELPPGLPGGDGDLFSIVGRTIGFVDWTGNGAYDAFIGSNLSGSLDFYENTGTAEFPLFVQRTGTANPLDGFDFGFRPKAQFADLDDDGLVDAIVASEGGLFWLRGTGGAASVDEWQSY